MLDAIYWDKIPSWLLSLITSGVILLGVMLVLAWAWLWIEMQWRWFPLLIVYAVAAAIGLSDSMPAYWLIDLSPVLTVSYSKWLAVAVIVLWGHWMQSRADYTRARRATFANPKVTPEQYDAMFPEAQGRE